jgi:tetratricopeptide (TPR) repeat protein
MKLLLLMICFFLGTAMQAQTYAPYTGNKANGTAATKPAPAKNKETKKPVVAEKAPPKGEEKPSADFQDFMRKAIEQLHQKDYEKALGFYTQALEVSTEQTACIALVSRATLYAIMKEDEKAVADLTMGIKNRNTPQKQLAIIYIMRARLYANNKNLDLACQDVAKAKALGLPAGFTIDVECK